MKKLSGIALVILLSSVYSNAAVQAKKQQQQSTTTINSSANAQSRGQVNAQSGAATLDSGSQIEAEMTSALNLKKAKPGDRFNLKTTRPVKRNGKEIISRGSTISGHVEQITRADNTTNATLRFDSIEDKKTHMSLPLTAVVTSVARAENSASAMSTDDLAAPAPSSGRQRKTQQPNSQQSGGGLLGGVTQTVGGTVGGVTQSVGNVGGQVNSTVSSTTDATLSASSGAAGALTRGAIQVVSNTTVSADSGSTLVFSNGNTNIESGTQFLLQTTSALVLTKNATAKEKK